MFSCVTNRISFHTKIQLSMCICGDFKMQFSAMSNDEELKKSFAYVAVKFPLQLCSHRRILSRQIQLAHFWNALD